MTDRMSLPTLIMALAIVASALPPAPAAAADTAMEREPPAGGRQAGRVPRDRILQYPDIRPPRYIPAWAIAGNRTYRR